MKPKRIILVRHGHSMGQENIENYATIPDPKIPLSPTGHKQAFEAGGRLAYMIGGEKVWIYCSPYYRTRQTRDGIIKGMDYVGDRIINSILA